MLHGDEYIKREIDVVKREVVMRILRRRDIPICVDAYMKMVEIVGQRRENARLLIRLNTINPVYEFIPKEITRQYSDTVTLVAEKWPQPVFYFHDGLK